MEGENHTMHRVHFLRWYFGFQLDCNICILEAIFVASPLYETTSHVFRERTLRTVGARTQCEYLHCLWGPARYRFRPDKSNVEYYQQGKLHRSDGPAAIKQILCKRKPQEIHGNYILDFANGEQQLFYKEGKEVPPF